MIFQILSILLNEDTFGHSTPIMRTIRIIWFRNFETCNWMMNEIFMPKTRQLLMCASMHYIDIKHDENSLHTHHLLFIFKGAHTVHVSVWGYSHYLFLNLRQLNRFICHSPNTHIHGTTSNEGYFIFTHIYIYRYRRHGNATISLISVVWSVVWADVTQSSFKVLLYARLFVLYFIFLLDDCLSLHSKLLLLLLNKNMRGMQLKMARRKKTEKNFYIGCIYFRYSIAFHSIDKQQSTRW